MMIARKRRTERSFRLTAALVVCATLSWLAPPTASAADEFWGLWASEVKQRVWWERPFAILVSFPAMVVTTPFWAGSKAVGAMSGPSESERAHEND